MKDGQKCKKPTSAGLIAYYLFSCQDIMVCCPGYADDCVKNHAHAIKIGNIVNEARKFVLAEYILIFKKNCQFSRFNSFGIQS